MLSIQNLNKTYKDKARNKVFENFNLSVDDGEFVAVFGPNGCGKSTLLNSIAGLTEIDKGDISFNDTKVDDLKIGFVFQDYKTSLFPWLTASENISFPLKISKINKNMAEKRVKRMLKKYKGNFNLKSYPYELSGGQQQFVALLRSLTINPDIILLDEPFSSLDYQTTLLWLERLSKIWQELKITTLFVSHEIDDAIFLAQRIILLSNRPTRIIKTFEVNEKYPRKLSFMTSSKFSNIKRNILSLYEKEIRKN